MPCCGDTKVPRLQCALKSMFCMPSQHHAIGLQTGCMVTVLAPVVEAARLPHVCPMALGYGLPPCTNSLISPAFPVPTFGEKSQEDARGSYTHSQKVAHASHDTDKTHPVRGSGFLYIRWTSAPKPL